MRLMYVLPAEAFGGAERQGVLHIRRLGDHDIELTAVVGPGKPIQDALSSYGYEDFVVCDDFPRSTHAKMGVGGNLLFGLEYARAFFRASKRLTEIGRSAEVDLILAGRSFGWAVAARAAKELGIPYMVRAGSRATNPALLLAIRTMCRRYGRPAALLSNCLAVEKNLIQAFDCPGLIVPNGVDTARFSSRSIDAVQRSRGPVVGLAARPAPEKGMDVFTETVRQTCAIRPDALFLVAGEFGWREYFEKEVARLGLADRIRFLGHVASMPDFFASCDLVVLTSPEHSIEGSPNAILEAMSMARPVVTSNVGGLPEIIRDGVEGYLVDPQAPERFASRIIELLSQPALAEQMGLAARSRILERFSEEMAMQALVGALHRVHQAGANAAQPARFKSPNTANW